MVQIIGQRIPIQENTAEPAVPLGLGNIFAQLSTPFMDTVSGDLKRSSTALHNVKTEEQVRINAAKEALATLAATGRLDPAAAAAAGIRGDLDPKTVGGYGQYLDVSKFGPASPEATRAAVAVPGSNYGNTVAGTREDFSNKRTMQGMQEATKLRVEAQKPTTVLVNDVPTVMRQDQSYGKPASVGLTEQQGAEARRALAQPGGIDTMSPAGQKFIGAQPSADDLVNATMPDGTIVPARATASGLVHSQTGQKLPDDIGPAGKMVATGADALKPTDPIVKELYTTRTNTAIARNGIKKTIDGLSQPNADQAVGYLGKGATVLNNVRSQFEAAARLSGGGTLNDELKADNTLGQSITQATNVIAQNPQLVAKMQALSIDSATLQSRISDLAYMIAKARDPSGRMSNQDVEQAAHSVGAALMDPKAGIAVLKDLDNGLVDTQRIREEQLTRTYGTKVPGMQPSAQTQPVAPAAPAPTGGVIQWGRGPDGRPMRVQ